jgi:hypothetical protein
MEHAIAIVGLGLLCAVWVIVQRALGDERGSRRVCCRDIDVSAADPKAAADDRDAPPADDDESGR